MTPRTALGALHIGALMFGLTGVFGKLAAASPAVIVFGRAVFAVLALAMFARFASNSRWQKLRAQDARPATAPQATIFGHPVPAVSASGCYWRTGQTSPGRARRRRRARTQ